MRGVHTANGSNWGAVLATPSAAAAACGGYGGCAAPCGVPDAGLQACTAQSACLRGCLAGPLACRSMRAMPATPLAPIAPIRWPPCLCRSDRQLNTHTCRLLGTRTCNFDAGRTHMPSDWHAVALTRARAGSGGGGSRGGADSAPLQDSNGVNHCTLMPGHVRGRQAPGRIGGRLAHTPAPRRGRQQGAGGGQGPCLPPPSSPPPCTRPLQPIQPHPAVHRAALALARSQAPASRPLRPCLGWP